MHFLLIILAIYYRVPSISAENLYRILGIPQDRVRTARDILVRNGDLEKDVNLNYNITEKGLQHLQELDREKAMEEIEFARHRTEVIKIALGVQAQDIIKVAPVSKGMTNDSYVFTCHGKKYIYRKAGKGSEALVDRNREYNTYLALEGKNISDKIIYHSAADGTKITEFIENTRAADKYRNDDLKACVHAVRKLHNSDIVSPHEFDFASMTDYYEKLCLEENVSFFPEYTENKEHILSLLRKCDEFCENKVFCHIDFVPDNCLITPDGNVTLIDWEYAGEADRIVDIAMFCNSSRYNRSESEKLLELYLERKPQADEYARLFSYISAAGMLWSLWSEYKAATGEKFTGYTQESLNMALKYSDYAREMFAEV